MSKVSHDDFTDIEGVQRCSLIEKKETLLSLSNYENLRRLVYLTLCGPGCFS